MNPVRNLLPILLLVSAVSVPSASFAATTQGGRAPLEMMLKVHDANAVHLPVTNTGQIGHNLYLGNGETYWPAGTLNNYLFGCGMWIGGLADLDGDGTRDTVVVMAYDPLSGGSDHREGRVGQSISDPLARVFSSTDPADLAEWPPEFRDDEGTPIVHSAQDFVTIYNDLSGYPLLPPGQIGIEVKQRSMAFVGGTNFNTILLFYEITNRSDSLPGEPYTLEETYLAFRADPDVGYDYVDDMTSVLDSATVYGRGQVALNAGIAWDSDFTEEIWEGKVGFVGTTFLQPPGNAWDGIDNDGDGLTDESPFNGIDDDGDGTVDDLPDEVDALDEFHYTWTSNPSTSDTHPDPQTDREAYRMMRCLTAGDCGEFEEATDIRNMISYGQFDLPPGESQIAVVAIVFANPVGDPDHLDLFGDPPRPDPQDSVLSELVTTILSARSLYESGFEDAGAPFMIFNTTDLHYTNDPAGPYAISTQIIDSIPLSRNTLHYSIEEGLYQEVLLAEEPGNFYSGEIPGQPFWSSLSYFIQAVDSAYQVLRDPWDAPLSAYELRVVDVPTFRPRWVLAEDPGDAVAPADFDLDGLTDIFLAAGGNTALYRYEGDFTFEDVTDAAGISIAYWMQGASWADYDNDGYPDLFIAGYNMEHSHFLYHNNGNGTFENVAAASGTADSLATSCGIWGDVNGDGLLDLFTAQYGNDRLYMNRGDGTFEDRAHAMGIVEEANDRTASFIDIDGDRDPDLILAGGQSNIVYRNMDGTGFIDITASSGIATNVSWTSLEAGDYDGDGDADILFSGGPLTLYENTSETGVFSDVTSGLGLAGIAEDASWADVNLDGNLDIVTTDPALYIGNPGAGFLDLTGFSGVADFEASFYALPLDLNDDGLLELMLTGINENEGYPEGVRKHWLKLLLHGTLSNAYAVGAKARLYAGESASAGWVSGGGGKSQSSPLLYFGIDSRDVIDSLVISWPSGIVQKVSGPGVDQLLVIEEDSTLSGIGGGTGQERGLPRAYALLQNYPNPFNPVTSIVFDIAGTGESASGRVKTALLVYDVRGRLVKRLLEADLLPGRHTVVWDGRAESGESVASGIYFYRIEAGNFQSTRKMLAVK